MLLQIIFFLSLDFHENMHGWMTTRLFIEVKQQWAMLVTWMGDPLSTLIISLMALQLCAIGQKPLLALSPFLFFFSFFFGGGRGGGGGGAGLGGLDRHLTTNFLLSTFLCHIQKACSRKDPIKYTK